MAITPITDANFEENIKDSSTLKLVDFWASWCGPCRQLSPILEELSDDYKGRIEFYSVDVDANPIAPANFKVTGIPNLIVFKDGDVVGSLVGARPKKALAEAFDKLLA